MWPLRPTRQELAATVPFAGLLLLSNLAFLFRDQTDKVLLASLVAPSEAAYFGMAQRLTAVVMQMCVVIFIPFTAAIGALAAHNDWPGIRQLYLQAASWMGTFAGLVAFLICVLRQPLFVLWIGESHPESFRYLPWLLIGTTSAIILAGIGVALAKGLGRPGLETTYSLLALVLVVLTKPALVAVVGPLGAVASSAGSWCIGAAVFLVLLHRAVDLSRETMVRTVRILLVTGLASGVGWWLGGRCFPVVSGRVHAAAILLLASLPLAAVYLALMVKLRLIQFSSWSIAPSALTTSSPWGDASENASPKVAE
jgi:O-antigen/teichoic acid export membrane protein